MVYDYYLHSRYDKYLPNSRMQLLFAHVSGRNQPAYMINTCILQSYDLSQNQLT